MGSANDVEKLERRLDELGDAIVMDPMSVTALDVDAVEAAVDELGRRAEAAEHFRIEALAHVATARALLDELRDAERAAAEAHREVEIKIAAPRVVVPDAPPLSDDLTTELDRIGRLIDEQQWHGASVTLADWTEHATRAARCATECAEANRAPIAARNELRGRLDGYRAKAYRLGAIEDVDVSELYEAARVALFTAPTDLMEAADAVGRFRRVLPNDAASGDEPR